MKSTKKTKAQSTIEFSILMSFMILLFSAFFVMIMDRLVQVKDERDDKTAQEISEIILNEISLARQSKDGYFRQFRIPTAIQGSFYNVSVENNVGLVVSVGKKIGYSPLPANVSGNISKGINNVSKENGIIMLSPK